MSIPPFRSGAKAARWFLIAFAAVSLLALPLRCWFVFKGQATAAIDGGLAGLAETLGFEAILLFAGWLGKVYGTLPFLGYRTRYTPRMAVALFLIPFANYFQTGDVVNELIAGTDFTKVAPTARVQRVRIPAPVRLWWYVFLAGLTLSNVATAIVMQPGALRASPMLITLIVAGQLLLAASALLARRFVETIESRMQNCVARLRMTGQKDVERAISLPPIKPSVVPLNALHASLLALALLRVYDVMLTVRLQSSEKPVVTSADQWLMLGVLAVSCITALTFIWWVSRIATNLRAMGLTTMSPAWAAGGLMIPIFNVVHAHSVMRAMWTGARKRLQKPDDGAVPFALAVDDQETPPAALTIWFLFWSATILAASYMQAIRFVPDQHDTFIILNYAVSLLIIISALALYVATSEINEELQVLEPDFIKETEALKRAVLAAVTRPEEPQEPARPAAKPASWAEVLLPIATAVDQGLASETPAQRQERILVDKQAVSQRAISLPRIPIRRVAGTLTKAAGSVALSSAQLAERAMTPRPYRPAAKFTRTAILTNVLRIVMLFSLLFVELALVAYAADSSGARGGLLIYALFVALLGLPTWLLLAGWTYITQRNIEALDPWTIVTPSRGAMFRFREPRVWEAILQSAFQGLDVSRARRLRAWSASLRVVQLSPVILFIGAWTPLKPAAAIIVALALLVWCISTAVFVREIDAGVERLSYAPQAPRPDAPDERPRQSQRGDADGGDDRPAVVGQHAGGE